MHTHTYIYMKPIHTHTYIFKPHIQKHSLFNYNTGHANGEMLFQTGRLGSTADPSHFASHLQELFSTLLNTRKDYI